MNVAIGGEPLFLAAGGDGFEFHHDTARLFRLERKLLDDRFVKETAINFQAIILSSGKIKCRSTLEQDEMRFVACRDLQSLWPLTTMPDPFPVKEIETQWKVSFDRTEPERLVRLERSQ